MKVKNGLQPLDIGVALLAPCLCPVQISGQTMVTQVKDSIAPSIVITSPAEGSLCANIVEIVGQGHRCGDGVGKRRQVRSLSYAVSGSTVSGQVDFAADGTFIFQFSTVTLGTNFTLAITAVDWNGNTAQVSAAPAQAAGNGIPSFAVSPGNKQVTLTWDSVPHTASYTLYYTTNGSLPSEQVGQRC